MAHTIVKRDGLEVPFDKMKICNAVLKAFAQVDGTEETDYALVKAGNIADFISEKERESEKPLQVEEIQDFVEKGLMSLKNKNYAKEYILYRNERTRERNKRSELIREIGDKLMGLNIQNSNANMDEASFGGRKGEAANALLKQYALDYIVSKKVRDNHLANRIYIHDLDSYALGMHNCLTVPFDHLLKTGFNTRQVDIRPANSVSTALQLVAVVFQIQSLQQFGGVSASHLDWTLVPYVRKSFKKHLKDAFKYIARGDAEIEEILNSKVEIGFNYPGLESNYPKAYAYAIDMTKKELRQAIEGMYHNLNSLQSRSGNQLPFSSINYGSCTLPEGRMVIKALLEGSIKGVGKHHKTSIFPCGIFQVGKGVNLNPGDPNYDLFLLALKSTAKRLYPNYANLDWSGNAGYDPKDPRTFFSTMGCRTANGWDINGFGQLKDGRGNIAPTTIILPTLAMEAKDQLHHDHYDVGVALTESNLIEEFIDILEKAIEDAKDGLIERFNYICEQNPASAKFMYENGTMEGYIPSEGIRSALKHGTLAIGQLGLAETLQILIGKDHTTKKGMKLAKRIEQLFKSKCTEYKDQYHLNFGVYYTPAENLCFTAMKKFKDRYGIIKNVSENDFFTNSMHVPVWKDVTPFEKIDIESQLTGYSSAGCITYVELDAGVENNIPALETIVRYAMEKDIPYFAINVPNDTCLDCGYMAEFNDHCPECGSKHIQQLRRVTGYLTGDYKTAFNLGKQQEVELRRKHGTLRNKYGVEGKA